MFCPGGGVRCCCVGWFWEIKFGDIDHVGRHIRMYRVVVENWGNGRAMYEDGSFSCQVEITLNGGRVGTIFRRVVLDTSYQRGWYPHVGS